jgi:hypothetical protein
MISIAYGYVGRQHLPRNSDWEDHGKSRQWFRRIVRYRIYLFASLSSESPPTIGGFYGDGFLTASAHHGRDGRTSEQTLARHCLFGFKFKV